MLLEAAAALAGGGAPPEVVAVISLMRSACAPCMSACVTQCLASSCRNNRWGTVPAADARKLAGRAIPFQATTSDGQSADHG